MHSLRSSLHLTYAFLCSFLFHFQSGYPQHLKWIPLGDVNQYELCITDNKFDLYNQPVLYAALYNREGQIFIQKPFSIVQGDSSIIFRNIYAYYGIKEVWLVDTKDMLPKDNYENDLDFREEGFRIIKKYPVNLIKPVEIPLPANNKDIARTIIRKNSVSQTITQVTNEIISLLNHPAIQSDSLYQRELVRLIDDEILTFYNVPFFDDDEIGMLASFEKQIIALSGSMGSSHQEQVMNCLFRLVQFAKQNYIVSSDDLLRINDRTLQNSVASYKKQFRSFLQNPELHDAHYFKSRSALLLDSLGISTRFDLVDLWDVKTRIKPDAMLLYLFMADEQIKCLVINSENALNIDICSRSEMDTFFGDLTMINNQTMQKKYSDMFLVNIWNKIENVMPSNINRIYISGVYYLNYLDFGSILIDQQPLFLSYEFAYVFDLGFLEEDQYFQDQFSLSLCGDISYSPSLKSVNIMNRNDLIVRVPDIYESKTEMDYFTQAYDGRINTLRGYVKEEAFRDFFEQCNNDVFFYSGHSISIISDASNNYIPSALLLSDVNSNLSIRKFNKNLPDKDDGVFAYDELKNLSNNKKISLVFLSSCHSSLGSLDLNFKPASLSGVFRLKTEATVISSTTAVQADYASDFAKLFFEGLDNNRDLDLVSIFNLTKRKLHEKYSNTGNFIITL